MRIRLDRRCPSCGAYLEFAERGDGVYVLCRRCRMAVYVPRGTAAEYAADFPALVELMVGELAGLAGRGVGRKSLR
jgi:hypothetical protein